MLSVQLTKSLLSNSQFSSSSALLRIANNAMNSERDSLHDGTTLDGSSLVKKVIELPTQNTMESTAKKTKIFTSSFQKQVNCYMQEQASLILHKKQNHDSQPHFTSLDSERKQKTLSKRVMANAEENEVKKQKLESCNSSQINEDSISDNGLTSLYTQANKLETKQKHNHSSTEQDISIIENEKRSLKPKNIKPNYFLAVQLNSQHIREKIEGIQDHIRNRNKTMEKCFVPISTLHVTLCVMTLSSVEDQQRVASALSLCCSKISNILGKTPSVELKYENLSTFREQVLYMDLAKNQGLSTLVKIVVELKRCFTELRINFKQEEFTPHLTVMKMSRCQKQMRKAGIKRISPKLYEKFKEETFGTDVVTDIQLCSMTEEKAPDGFYKVLAKIDLENPTDVKLLDGTKETSLDIFDLSSYAVLPRWKEEVENFTIDSSWHEITKEEIEEAKHQVDNKDSKEAFQKD